MKLPFFRLAPFARTMGPRVIPPDVTADPKSSPFEWGPGIEEPNDPKALKAFARLVTKVWKPKLTRSSKQWFCSPMT